MDLGVPYIPMDRRQALARGEELPARATGAALFADISGFTPLTEALAAELGPRRGAEELTSQLDLIYGAIIAQVDKYRGSVIGFAGDAITCWFDGDAGQRALACALAMQAVMGEFGRVTTPSGVVISLAIKVAVAAGAVRRYRVGTPAVQYIDVLAGATLYRMAEAEHQATKGEVVVAPEVVAALDDALVVQEWRHDAESGHSFAVVSAFRAVVEPQPWPELPPASLDAATIRSWLHDKVYERLAAGQGGFLAELRPAVALFMRFGGLDFDTDADAGTKLDAFICWVQGIVARYEGTLIQLTIGDKGSFLYSAFGAPVAHDDDASRAVAAALELRALPAELAFITTTQIGISRGRMRVGAYGGPTARTYGVLGDEVNLAARLMGKAAPDQIMVSQLVADAVGQYYDLEFVGPLSVKGKREPVQVSLVHSRRAAPRRSAALYSGALVGRDAEIAQLADLLDAVQAAGGRIVRLEGPPGVGKSRLAAALIERAVARGFQIATGICQSTAESMAYAPWRQALGTMLGLDALEPGADSAATVAAQIAHIEAQMAAANPEWLLRLPLLGDLLGLPIPDNATTAAFEPRLRQSALFDLVVELAQHWARRQPLLILLDDVHWIDEASQGLTVALARALGGHHILLALTHRPALPEKPILPALDDLAGHSRIDLADLTPAAIASLIAARLDGVVAPLALAVVQSETQGNPFFVEEMVNALRESGGLVLAADGRWNVSPPLFAALRRANCLLRQDDEWVLALNAPLSSLDLGVPDSIEGVVLSRLDRLPEAPKLTLKVASVIGRIFAFMLLARAHPLRLAPETLNSQIESLQERDFAKLEVPPPDTAYIFRHNVTHDVAYQTLLFEQRRDLHCAVGSALEALTPQAIDQLAYHTFLGEDWQRALGYQLEAGRRAQRLFANHEAIEHLEKALRCAASLPEAETLAERQQIHLRLGQLLTSTGQYEPAQEHLIPALALAEQLADREAQATACRWIARIYENKAEFSAALEWIWRGLAALGARETSARAELLAIASLITNRQGNFEAALARCEESAAIAQKLGDRVAWAFATNAQAIVHFNLGNSAKAIEYFQQALRLYEESENIHGQAMSFNGIANAYYTMGEWGNANSYWSRARKVFVQIGDLYNQIFVNNNLAETARLAGRLAEALAYYQDALRLLDQLGGSPYVKGAVQMNLGATYTLLGDLASARLHLASSADYFAQARTRDFLAELQRHFAAQALASGDLPAASRYAHEALREAQELSMRAEEGSSLRMLGEIAGATGDLAQAAQFLDQSVQILEEGGQGYELALGYLSQARLFFLQRRDAAALAALDRCEPTFQRLDAQLDLTTARLLRTQINVPHK